MRQGIIAQKRQHKQNSLNGSGNRKILLSVLAIDLSDFFVSSKDQQRRAQQACDISTLF